MIYFFYRWLAWPLMRVGFAVLALFLPKIRLGLAMREKVDGRAPWLRFEKGQRPVWIHCASGEFEYAKPVITRLKRARPDLKIMVTYFSPSIAKAVPAYPGVDFATVVPWDRTTDLREFLSWHQPRALLIARTDAWPVMTHETRRARVPSLLFSATLADSSGRARPGTKWISGALLEPLTTIFCVTPEDAASFAKLGLGDRTQVQGDTRYDQVIARLEAPKPLRAELFTPGAPILVAGSTWPEDEAVLIEVASRLQGRARFIFVPHEPTPQHVSELQKQLETRGLKSVLYSSANEWRDEVLIVDRVGLLAELYLKGQFAFVGGSFRKTVHSVMEPLAAGALTFLGPRHTNNREALEFRSVVIHDSPTFHAVEAVANAEEFASRFEEALALGDFSARLKAEIRARSGKSDRVVDWTLAHIQ